MRKVVLCFLVVCISLLFTGSHLFAVDENDFANNEQTYYTMCSQTGLTSEQKETCKLFQQYLTEKANQIQQDIDAANKELDAIKSDLNVVLKKINSLNQQIEDIEKQQQALQSQINAIEVNIAQLEVEIAEREQRIAEIDEQIRLRMNNMQSIISLNKYIEYLMGATDFADLIRRTSAINELMEYDANQMRLLEEEKAQLQLDVKELKDQKDSLASQKELLEEMKATLEEAKKTQQAYQAEYLKKQAEIEAEKRDTVAGWEEIQDAIKDISDNLGYVAPSAGWIYPIKERFYISAGAWYYPKSFGGGMHLGVDFAASTSKHVVAPANGVVAYTYDKCTTGGLGNGCGGIWGGGNIVYLLVQVGNRTYGVLNCHMSRGLSVEKGQVITQGTVLGRVGSTGNSSGPHLHVEIYDLGTMSLSTALAKFKSTGDVTFGARWYTLSTTCDKKGTPCRMNPQKIFNVTVGKSYN